MAMTLLSREFLSVQELTTWATANISDKTKIVNIVFDAGSGMFVIFFTP
jgi:hypothetical protein